MDTFSWGRGVGGTAEVPEDGLTGEGGGEHDVAAEGGEGCVEG